MAEGFDVLDTHERLAPTGQCHFGRRAAARGHDSAERPQHDQQRGRGVQKSVRVPRPVQRRGRFLQAQGRHRARPGARPRDAAHELHSRYRELRSSPGQQALPGWRRVEPFMTDNCFYFWTGQHENGRYSKGHAHTSAAVLICVKGQGYTYTWPERLGVTPWKDGRAGEVKRVDYEPVGMVSAAPGGARWYHQHFSVSKDPFRLTAWVGPHNPGRDPGAPGEDHTDSTPNDVPARGN